MFVAPNGIYANNSYTLQCSILQGSNSLSNFYSSSGFTMQSINPAGTSFTIIGKPTQFEGKIIAVFDEVPSYPNTYTIGCMYSATPVQEKN